MSAERPPRRCSQISSWLVGRRVVTLELPLLLTEEDSKAFPDISFTLLFPYPLIAEGDYVVARWFGGGKHTGPAFFDLPIGALPQPNSGKAMQFSGTTIYTLKEGKIVEETGEEAGFQALQQLGLLPPN
jgi:predicted ester cyclase